MRSVFIISFLLLSISPIAAQEFTRVKEIRITEQALGKVAFHFTDNDQNGQFEFITDANNKAGIFTGAIVDNEIVTDQYKKFTQYADDLKDLRLEDTDQDGKNELYALYESAGLIILDTATLSPLDTISGFPVTVLFRRMILADIDHDQVNEWILLDGFDGLTVFELNSFTPKWSASQLEGRDMQLGNMDADESLELVLLTSNGIRIINIETLEEEYFIASQLYDVIELVDLNQDGIDELVLIDGTLLQVYDHSSTSIVDDYNTGGIHFDDRFYMNMDSDTALEIILYQPDFNGFVELNTYPLTFIANFELPDEVNLGWHAGPIPGSPDKIIFMPDEGISILDYVTKTVETTTITGTIASTISTRFDHIADEVLITHPAAASWDYLSFRTLNDFKTVYTLSQHDLFEGHIAGFATTVDKLHTRGIHTNHLLINNNREFAIYDPVHHSHIDYLDLQGNFLSAADLDHDGSDELLNILNNSIHVYQQSEAWKFQHLFSTPPTELYTTFRTGQLDQTPQKEIIAFNYQKILVYNGVTGALLHEVTGIPSSVYQDVTTFTDHSGDFFIAVMNSGTYYVYNYTKKMLVKTFSFYGSTTGFTKIFQVLEAGQLKTYILIHSDRFQVYTPDGNPVFIEDLATGSNKTTSKIIINDYNQDGNPDILLSGGSKFTIYTYTGSGESVEAFYATSIFPKDSVSLNAPTSYVLQFSESILPGSITVNIGIDSKKQGNLDFEIEWIDPFQIKVTHEPLQFNRDTITLMLHGSLQSESMKFLDSNLDGLGMQAQEPVALAVYLYDSTATYNKPTIAQLSTEPEFFYSESNRHLNFQVNSDTTAPFPISFLNSGIISDEIQTSDSLLPVDWRFDEPVEEFLVPVPTIGLTEGWHTLFVVAGDVEGHLSDTFFLPFQVIMEGGHYDKNAGGGHTRTQYMDNQRITPYLNQIHTKLHASNERLSHLVGGDGYVYYLVNNSFDRFLVFRKASLPNFETVWERTFDSYAFRSSIHLSDGVVYFIRHASQDSEYRVFAFDAISGQEIWNEQIFSRANLTGSPVTDGENVLVTGGEYGGTYCFDRWTGEQKWYSKRDNTHSEEGIPAIYKDAAYLVEHTTIKSVDISTGELNWEIEVNEEEPYLLYRNALVDTIHQQLIWPGKNNLYAFDLETGNQKWRRPGSFSIKNPVHSDNLIFLFKSNSINIINATTGSNISTHPLSSTIIAQPVAANGKLFLPLADRFEVLDMGTMATLWTVPIVVQEISIIDQYLLITDNMHDVHVYESSAECCTPANVWTEAYSNAFSPEMHSLKFTFSETPVTLDGNTYHEILSTDQFANEPLEQTGYFIRASGKRVYQYRFGQERLLYDYNAAVGDTFYTLHDAALAVTATDSIVLTNGETRRRLTLECTQIQGFPPTYWIDGIGSTFGFTQTSTCQPDWYTILLCAYLENENIYLNPEVDSCWVFTTSTIEDKYNISLIYPNPFDDHILIEADPLSITSVSLIDLLGRTVCMGKDVFLNTSHILPGSYVLSVKFKHGYTTNKVMTKW